MFEGNGFGLSWARLLRQCSPFFVAVFASYLVCESSLMSNEPSDSSVPFNPRLDGIETRWSLLRRSSDVSSVDSEQARQTLVLRYASAIRSYCRAILGTDDGADELSQDVIVRLLKGDFGGADPDRGRFRDLMRTAIRNMARNHWKRESKRSHAVLIEESVEGQEDEQADPWLQQWRDTILENTWRELEHWQHQHAGSCLYSVLRTRSDHPTATSEQLSELVSQQLGRSINAGTVRQNLKRARTKFTELLVEEVADGLDDPTRDRVQDELIALGLWDLVKDVLPEQWMT